MPAIHGDRGQGSPRPVSKWAIKVDLHQAVSEQ